jgi:3-oxoacyl-(acyl-carrier-protein) synthase
MDRGTRMLLLAIREALAQAGRQNMEGIDAMVIGTSAGAMPLGEPTLRTQSRIQDVFPSSFRARSIISRSGR